MGIISDLDSMSRYLGADSTLRTYGLEALEHACEHYRSERRAATSPVKKEQKLRELLLVKRVVAGSGNPFRESCREPSFEVHAGKEEGLSSGTTTAGHLC